MRPHVPEWLQWLRDEPGGAEWLARLPGLVEECALAWELNLEPPFRGEVSYVAAAVTSSGLEVVLKVSFPSTESEHEPAALRQWDGRGAVRLLDEDVDKQALLLERCRPGRLLWSVPEQEATREIAGVFERLWTADASPDAPFQPLHRAAAVWCDHLTAAWTKAGAPFELELLEEAVAFMQTVGAPPGDSVVLHQDLHGGNVLRRGAEWVAIDPKPLVGERAFDLASFLRDRRDLLQKGPDSQEIVRGRLDYLCARLGIDRERARGWGLGHALAWSFDAEGRFYEDHIHAARLVARC